MANGSRFTGAAAMGKNLAAIARKFPIATAGSLFKQGSEIMGRSQEEFVPVDLATLKDSGHVKLPEIKGNTISVELAYGGAAADYALAVHETPSEHDPESWKGKDVQFHPQGHGSKYLERPLMEKVPTLATDIARDLRLSGLK